MTDNTVTCKFTWLGKDGKEHMCFLAQDHGTNVHECDCGQRKYGGPDPPAWRKKK